jgi:hypothetical protein
MRSYFTLVLLLLCLYTTVYAQTSVLDTKVSLHYKEVAIGNILKDLNKRYQLKFSYSSNIVPEDKKVTVQIKNVMLKDALTDLFSTTDVAFQVVGDQIVLKKGVRKTSASTQQYRTTHSYTPPVLYDPSFSNEELTVHNGEELIIEPIQEKIVLPPPVLLEEDHYRPTQKDLRRKYKGEKKMLKARFYVLKDSLRRKGDHMVDKLEMKYNYVSQKLKQEFDALKRENELKGLDTFQHVPLDTLVSFEDSLASRRAEYLYRPFQITFVSPLGTNGLDGPRTVNNVSINVIGGVAAGLEGVEMAGVANVEKDYVEGIQMAGVANVVKGPVEGIQLAGVVNLCGDSAMALQASGFANIVKGNFEGLQSAGFCNLVSGTMEGFQGAGFINIANDSIHGMQVAGFANITKANIEGIQAAGFINIARKVKGVQIGIINIADSIQGVPLGFISIVKKDGYRRLEFSGTEALHANIAFKMGVRSFYNIFQVGAHFTDKDIQIATGYGIGTERPLGEKLFVNLEAISFQVWERHNRDFDMNLLNKFNTTFGVKLGKTFSIFAGPSFNVMVSQYRAPGSTEVGSDIMPYTLFNQTYGTSYKDLNLKMWVGVNAGIRF